MVAAAAMTKNEQLGNFAGKFPQIQAKTACARRATGYYSTISASCDVASCDEMFLMAWRGSWRHLDEEQHIPIVAISVDEWEIDVIYKHSVKLDVGINR